MLNRKESKILSMQCKTVALIARLASVAALSMLRESGVIGADETAVCIATGSGLRWSAAFAASDDGQPEPVLAGPGGVT